MPFAPAAEGGHGCLHFAHLPNVFCSFSLASFISSLLDLSVNHRTGDLRVSQDGFAEPCDVSGPSGPRCGWTGSERATEQLRPAADLHQGTSRRLTGRPPAQGCFTAFLFFQPMNRLQWMHELFRAAVRTSKRGSSLARPRWGGCQRRLLDHLTLMILNRKSDQPVGFLSFLKRH